MFWVLSTGILLENSGSGATLQVKIQFHHQLRGFLDKLHDLCASNSVTVKLHASFINPTNMTEDS